MPSPAKVSDDLRPLEVVRVERRAAAEARPAPRAFRRSAAPTGNVDHVSTAGPRSSVSLGTPGTSIRYATTAVISLRLSAGRRSVADVQPKPARPRRSSIVAVTGCLKENVAEYAGSLVNADRSRCRAPPTRRRRRSSQSAAEGRQERVPADWRVAEFNLPAHRDHTVLVKGLHIKATPDQPPQRHLGDDGSRQAVRRNQA